LRKETKPKSIFPTDDSIFKMLYLAMGDITAKWHCGKSKEMGKNTGLEGRINLVDVE